MKPILSGSKEIESLNYEGPVSLKYNERVIWLQKEGNLLALKIL